MAIGLNPAEPGSVDTAADTQASLRPLVFSGRPQSAGAQAYLREPLIRTLADFFESKGLAALKAEDQREQWYDDWLEYQREHRLYAQLISPGPLSTRGAGFNLLRFARFLEVFAYFSPAHGYSLQVTFLGLFAILMGDSDTLKREAIAALEAGELLAFGVSEQTHGSDLLANEFTVREADGGRLVADGNKYYIGNSNAAALIAVLGRKHEPRGPAYARRAPLVLFALRPRQAQGFRSVRKIETLGVRAAFVGEFELKQHKFPQSDLIAQGRRAWDAVFGSVTLGKFFLGFGSIGICEHALDEALAHLRSRMLYGAPAIQLPHLRYTMAQASVRLTAMKLYAYRALDYVHASSPAERRYLLYCAVQKARVSTEGVKVMALLSECIGARGFESDTYFEMALRDTALIPGLESSAHINLMLAAQFIPRYFGDPQPGVPDPPSLVAGQAAPAENSYLFQARSGAIHTIAFPRVLAAFKPLIAIPNVRLFAKQLKAFEGFATGLTAVDADARGVPLGQCVATIAYAQLIAENAVRLAVPVAMIAAIFHTLVADFSAKAMELASCGALGVIDPVRLRRMLRAPLYAADDWDFVADRMSAASDAGGVHFASGTGPRPG
jgi:acyl-CoA dehydrogenase